MTTQTLEQEAREIERTDLYERVIKELDKRVREFEVGITSILNPQNCPCYSLEQSNCTYSGFQCIQTNKMASGNANLCLYKIQKDLEISNERMQELLRGN